MRVYTVQAGDTPASIAARDDMAGCPKCAIDLVRANPHKPAITHPNGFATFRDMRAGERIWLPEKWFNGDLDSRPRRYFAALPHPDGMTHGTLSGGFEGVLGDYATLDQASMQVSALASMTDRDFLNAVPGVASLIDSSVQEAATGTNTKAAALAQNERASTDDARQRNSELTTAVDGGAGPAATEARLAVQNALSTALGVARIALQVYYADGQQPAPPPQPIPTPPIPTPPVPSPGTGLAAAAQAAYTALLADPNYCASVASPGSPVNSAVHAFKAAWNASGQAPVPIGTGNYEKATADALAMALGASGMTGFTVPPGCGARAYIPPKPSTKQPAPAVVKPPVKEELSTGAVVGISLAGAALVGGAVYFVTKRPKRRRKRARDEQEAEFEYEI